LRWRLQRLTVLDRFPAWPLGSHAGFKKLCPNPENEEELKEQIEFDARVLGVKLDSP